MNKMTRMLVMTGMAFAVSATIGAGAASASPAEPAAPSAAKAASQSADIRLHPGRTRVIGYFRSPLACHKVGRIGEFRDRWDDYSCVRVRGGFHRGSWALVARWDRHGWPGHGGGPGWPGHGNGPGNGHGHGHGHGNGPGNGHGHGPGQGPWNR